MARDELEDSDGSIEKELLELYERELWHAIRDELRKEVRKIKDRPIE